MQKGRASTKNAANTECSPSAAKRTDIVFCVYVRVFTYIRLSIYFVMVLHYTNIKLYRNT